MATLLKPRSRKAFGSGPEALSEDAATWNNLLRPAPTMLHGGVKLMSMHPSKEELSGFLLGKLPVAVTEAVAKHLEQCSPCQETIVGLETSQDTLLHKLREATPPSPSVAANSAKPDAPKPTRPSTPSGGDASFTSAFSPAAMAGKASAAPVPTREQFVAVLGASGVIDQDEWNQLQSVAAVAQATDGATLARALVQQGTLTKYQASALYQGKSKGLVFGEYVVLELLGSGGMGQVFKARHRSMDRIVALKVLAKAAVNSPDAVKRFQREVKAAAKLIHTNIVTAFDAGQQDGVHFLVMEYVPGSDLSALVKREGALPVDKVISYITQAARGLAFAHAKGVVHRDIKPGNLLVDGEGTVRILDMGLARLDGDAASKAAGEGLTQTGQVMGTLDYMAPEQAFDTSTADAKADMYSLGCTLYRLLTGHNMFSGETLVQKILAHREQPIPSLVAACPNVPPQLDAIYLRMVAKQPEHRPTMSELVVELESLSKGEPTATFVSESLAIGVAPNVVRVVKSSAAGTGRKPPSRKLLAAGAAGFVLLCLGVWVIVRDRDGKEMARVQVPEGGSTTIAQAANATATPTGNSHPASAVADSVLSPPSTDFNADIVFLGNGFVERWNSTGKTAWNKYFSKWRAINHAFGSRTIAGLKVDVDRLSVDGVIPRVIVVEVGGNNLGSPDSITKAIRDYQLLVARIKDVYQQSKIILNSSIFHADPGNTLDALHELNDSLRFMADGQSVYFLDLNPVLLDTSGIADPSLLAGHALSPLGYERWAEALEPLLTKLLTQPVANSIKNELPASTDRDADFALHFDGTSHVELPQLQIQQLSAFCLEAILIPQKPKSNSGTMGVISWDADSRFGLLIPYANGQGCWKARIGATHPPQTVNGSVRWGEVMHFAASSNGNQLTIFLNGKPAKSSEAKSYVGLLTRLVTLGTEFEGEICQARISTTARYQSEFVPPKNFEPDSDTIALYRFDEGSGDVLHDVSGHHYDAKIVGAKWVQRGKTLFASSTASVDREQAPKSPQKSVVDLLPLLKPAIHTDAKWELVDGAMQATIINKSRNDHLAFDYPAPTEYDLTVEVERLELGNGMGIRLGLANDETEFEVGIDMGALRNCDIKTVDEGRSTVQSRVRGPLLEVGKRQTVVVEVRRTGVALFLDGQKQCEYDGPLSRLSRDPAVRAKFPRFFLLSYVDARFHKLELRPYTDDPAVPKDSTRGTSSSPTHVASGATVPIDLLGLVELGSRSYGSWQREGTAVVATQDSKAPTIRHIPFTDSPTEYDLVAKWETIGDDGTITFGLPSDSIRFDIVAEMTHPVQLHLDVVEDKRLTSVSSHDVATGTEIELRLAVRRTGVTALLNGKEVLAYQGSLSKLSRGTDPPTQPFFIRVAGAARFHTFELIPVRAPADGGLGQDSKNPPRAIAPFDSVQARAHQEAWAKHLGTTVEMTNSAGVKMILIPPGEFQMGSSDADVEKIGELTAELGLSDDKRNRDETPQHRAVLTRPLWMSRSEITVAQFRKFADETGFQTEAEIDSQLKKLVNKNVTWRQPMYPVEDDFPVTVVTWNDAAAFCNWLSKQGKLNPAYQSDGNNGWSVIPQAAGYRLPTEAEWEFSCRAGSTSLFSFGDDAAQLEEYSWYDKSSPDRVSKVAQKLPNAFGLYDMHGNVWEWCQDPFKAYQASMPPNDPLAVSDSAYRIFRGGDWDSDAIQCRSAYRAKYLTTAQDRGYGFRIVREFPPIVK